MPSKSEKKRNFFGVLLAEKRGRLKNPSKKIKRTAAKMSESAISDFARTSKRDAVRHSLKY